jgi:ribose transport system substrate-binding protein
MRIWKSAGLSLLALGLAIGGCKKQEASSGGADGAGRKTVTIGLIGKSQSNQVFQATYSGAKAAAAELGKKYNVNVVIDWQTPSTEDAQKQADAIDLLVGNRVAGIALSCSDAGTVKPAIDRAALAGVPVMTFDSDSPQSKRFAYYGSDNATCGRLVMAELARIMGGKGTVAILAGNASAPNLQQRVDGAKEELAKHPGMKLNQPGVFNHEEINEKAAQAVQDAQRSNPGIQGWAFIGGWPLFTANALPWKPGAVMVVSVDALPAELQYVRDGYVEALFAQDCYGWGYKSVETILEKALDHKDPPQTIMIDPLTKVTKENVEEYSKKWEKWLAK